MADGDLLAQFDAQHGVKSDTSGDAGPDLLAAFDKSLTAEPFGAGHPPPGAIAVQPRQPSVLERLGDFLTSTHEIPVVSGAERGAAAGGLDLAGGIENLVGGVPAAVGGAVGHPELGDRFFQTGDVLRNLANQVAATGPQDGAAGAAQNITRGLAHYALGPELAAGAAATNTGAEGAQAGASLGQQFKAAALEGALAEAGGRIPIAGKTLPAKLAAGAGLGLAFPFAEHAGQHYLVGNENVSPLPTPGELATSEAMMLALPLLHAGGAKLADVARGRKASPQTEPAAAAPTDTDTTVVEAALRQAGFTDAQIDALKRDGSLGDIAAAATPAPKPALAGPPPDAPLPTLAQRALPAPEPREPAAPALPPPPRRLPPPSIEVDSAGNATTNAQAMEVARAAEAAAEERRNLGLTPDVERAQAARVAAAASEPAAPASIQTGAELARPAAVEGSGFSTANDVAKPEPPTAVPGAEPVPPARPKETTAVAETPAQPDIPESKPVRSFPSQKEAGMYAASLRGDARVRRVTGEDGKPAWEVTQRESEGVLAHEAPEQASISETATEPPEGWGRKGRGETPAERASASKAHSKTVLGVLGEGWASRKTSGYTRYGYRRGDARSGVEIFEAPTVQGAFEVVPYITRNGRVEQTAGGMRFFKTPEEAARYANAQFQEIGRITANFPHDQPVHEVSEFDLSPEDRELVQRTRARAAEAKDNTATSAQLRQESIDRGEREAGELGLRGTVVEALGPERVNNLHFVHDQDGLPPDVLARSTPIKRGNVRYGLHTPEGDSYIFTEHANTPERAAWTAIHEVGGHAGVRELVNQHPDVKAGTRTVAEAYESARKLFLQNPTVRRMADAIAAQRGSKDLPRMAEEAMAELQAANRTGRWDEIARKYGVDVPASVRKGVQGAMANFARRLKAILNAIYAKVTGKSGEAFTDADVHDMLDRMWEAAQGEQGRGEVMESQSPIKSVDANVRRGREAMARALTEKADQHRAMFRTGLGWVDFVWGDDGTPTGRAGTNLPGRRVLQGKGLAHLIGERMREDGLTQQGAERIAQRMVDVIARGSEVRRATYSGATRAVIEHDGYEAVLTKQDGSNTWLVTGFERKGAGGDTAANDTGVPTQRSADSSDRTQVAAPRADAGISGDEGLRSPSHQPAAGLDETLPRTGDEGRSETPSSPTHVEPIRSRPDEGAGDGSLPRAGDEDLPGEEPAQTDSPAFRRWFGESKVVDAEGKPLVVYHGTDAGPFSTFDRGMSKSGPSKFGFWFTNQESFADMFGGNKMPVYLRAENPLRITLDRWNQIRDAHAQDGQWFANWRDRLIQQGHDGLVVVGGSDKVGKFTVDNPDVIAVFEPTQIKSATGNRGTFDPEDANILHSEEPQDRADTFGRGAGGPAVPEPVVELPPRAPGESQKAYHARVIREGRATMIDGIKASVGLRTWTPEEKRQQAIGRGGLRAMWAKNQRAADKAGAAFRQAQHVFDKAGKDANLEAIHQWESGENVASAPHRLFFKAMDAEFQKRIEAIRAIAPGTLEHVIENYFPHLWEDPIKAGKWYQREYTKRPLEGNKSFLKQRVHATIKDGMASGLKPVSTNPVDLVLAKMAQMDKFLALHEFRKDLQDRGWLKEMEPGERVPYGYARVDDPAFVKAAGLQGFFAVPEAIARDLNNYLSPSLYRFAPFKAFRRLQNLVMMARLGWSAFHAGFTTLDNLVMHADVGVRYALDGDIKRALITWAKTPLSVVWSPIEGGKLNRQWLGLDKADANTAALLDALEQGGAHYKMDTSEYNQGLRRFIRGFQQKDYSKSARAALSAAGETGSWIIHHKLVPNQKMAARLLLAKSALDRVAGQLGRDRGDYAGIIEAMHPDALKQLMGDVVKNVDDRLGQMNYDNQFWNKTAREAAQAMIGAVGWQVGTVRTVTGGVRDIARLWNPEKLVSALDKDGKITNADMGRVSGRLTYLASLALIMGGGNAALQYMMTGKGPSELKDYFFPKTGNKNADGSDERLQLPTYWMDHYKLATHPLQTAEHKIHPMFSMIMEAIANQDYWGVEIHDPHASWAKQAEQIGEYVAKGFLPYSVTNNQKARQNEAGVGRQVSSFFGVTTAPASVSRSKFQSFVSHNGNKGFGHEKRTALDAEHSRMIKDIENDIRNGGKPDLSGLNRRDLLRVRRETREDVPEIQFKKMDIEDKLDAWDMATPDERQRYHLRRNILTSRGTETPRFRRLPADERHAILERISAIRHAQP